MNHWRRAGIDEFGVLQVNTPESIQPEETEVLRKFITLLMDPPVQQPWENLFPDNGHLAVRATYFLLHHEQAPGGDTEGFVNDALARILRQLSSRTKREHVESQGLIRGKVIWPATLKSRYTGDFDPTRFVCRESRRQFDTMENQLLRYLIEAIRHSISMVPAIIQAGTCYHPTSHTLAPITVAERLQKMQDLLLLFRNHGRLREITVPMNITEEHLQRAEQSKMVEYGLVAQLYRRYSSAMDPASWNGIIHLGQMGLPFPAQAEGDGLPWLRLAAAMVCSGFTEGSS